MELLKDFKEREVNNMCKIIIAELRDLRTILMSPKYSDRVKRAKYNRTCGFVHGFFTALVRTDRNKELTGNKIDLVYAYLNALYKEYIF